MKIKHELAVVCSVWKRPYLAEQVLALKGQTLPPEAIYVWHNGGYVETGPTRSWCLQQGLEYTWASFNSGFLGRYLFASLVPANYILILDDDMIPGPHFLENAMGLAMDGVLVCARGSRLMPGFKIGNATLADYSRQNRVHAPGTNKPVDFFLNGSLFHRNLLANFHKYPWPQSSHCPIDDLHFSITCALEGIPLVVPAQPRKKSQSTTKKYGGDDHASWKSQGQLFKQQRIDALNFYALQYGWRPLYCR